jgi:filamentous hemagglutinin
VAGELSLHGDGALRHTGSTQAGGHAALSAGGPVQLSGRLQAADATLSSNGAMTLDGALLSTGAVRFDVATDWLQRGLLQTGTLDVRAGGDLTLAGIVPASDDVQLRAGRDLRLQGLLSTAGSLSANALRDLWVLGTPPVAAEGASYQAGRRRVLPAGVR